MFLSHVKKSGLTHTACQRFITVISYILYPLRVGLGLEALHKGWTSCHSRQKNTSTNSCLAECQHCAHIPQMMSTPHDVMVLISRASVVGFGFSVWREKEKQDEVKCFDGVGQ